MLLCAIDAYREPGVDNPQPVLDRVGLEPEQAHERIQHGSARPGLRTASHGIADGVMPFGTALQTRIERGEL